MGRVREAVSSRGTMSAFMSLSYFAAITGPGRSPFSTHAIKALPTLVEADAFAGGAMT